MWPGSGNDPHRHVLTMNNIGFYVKVEILTRECETRIIHHGWKADKPAVGQQSAKAMVNNLGPDPLSAS